LNDLEIPKEIPRNFFIYIQADRMIKIINCDLAEKIQTLVYMTLNDLASSRKDSKCAWSWDSTSAYSSSGLYAC
jgi:hypothetical protein